MKEFTGGVVWVNGKEFGRAQALRLVRPDGSVLRCADQYEHLFDLECTQEDKLILSSMGVREEA